MFLVPMVWVPLEHHVLEQMCHTGDARLLVYGPDLRDPAGRNVRVTWTRHQQERHAVLELMLDDRNLLTETRCRQEENQHKKPSQRRSCHWHTSKCLELSGDILSVPHLQSALTTRPLQVPTGLALPDGIHETL